MPIDQPPDWWDFDLELSPHVEDRMIDRDFSEDDLRLMIEVASRMLSLIRGPLVGAAVEAIHLGGSVYPLRGERRCLH